MRSYFEIIFPYDKTYTLRVEMKREIWVGNFIFGGVSLVTLWSFGESLTKVIPMRIASKQRQSKKRMCYQFPIDL